MRRRHRKVILGSQRIQPGADHLCGITRRPTFHPLTHARGEVGGEGEGLGGVHDVRIGMNAPPAKVGVRSRLSVAAGSSFPRKCTSGLRLREVQPVGVATAGG